MSLNTKLKTLDGISDDIKSHYKETEDGSFTLELEGSFDYLDDVKRLKGSLENERNAHKQTKAKFHPYASLGKTFEEIQQDMDALEEFKLKSEDNSGEDFNAKLAAMLDIKEKKFQRKEDDYKLKLDALMNENTSFKTKEISRKMQDLVLTTAGDEVTPKAGKLLVMMAKNDLKYNDEEKGFFTNDGLPLKEWVDKTLMDNELLVKPAGGAGAVGSKRKGKKEDNSTLGIIGRLK